MLRLDRRTVAATGLALLAWAAPAAAQDLQDITFVQPSPSAINSFPIYVAIGEGYFADEGLNVSVESVNGSAAVLQALTADQAQFGRPGPGPLLGARARGVDVVFIYNQMPKSSFGIVVKEESTYQTPEDLKGQVIGVGTADGADVSFARGPEP
jgi:NitT/TauT family transport system substrate-binding protein